jgi:cellulose synthase/poly-beta-1,6-N-acetylglucosamine synthase-like glycosyltransferase
MYLVIIFLLFITLNCYLLTVTLFVIFIIYYLLFIIYYLLFLLFYNIIPRLAASARESNALFYYY